VHRVAWIIFRGEIPLERVIDHKCQNRRCFNPWHLEPVTTETNMNRAAPPGRSRYSKATCGEGHQWSEINTLWLLEDDQLTRTCKTCVLDPAFHKWPAETINWYRQLLAPNKRSGERRARMAAAAAQYMIDHPIPMEPTAIGYLVSADHMMKLAQDETVEATVCVNKDNAA